MDIHIVSVSVKIFVEDKGRVPKGARVNKTYSFLDFHLFNVKDKTFVEYLESDCALSFKQNDLIVRNFISQTHVGWHAIPFVDLQVLNLLPHIPRDVVNFNRVKNPLLVDTASKGEDVVVLKGTKRHSSSWYTHIINLLPLVLLSVIHLAAAVNLVVDKSS